MAEAKKKAAKAEDSSKEEIKDTPVVEAVKDDAPADIKNTKVEAVTDKAEEPEVKEDKATAKAGKRSAKAVKETEEKQAKQERKAEAPETDVKSKPVQASKTRAERAGKKYREVLKLIDKTKEYALPEALELAAKSSPVKFDASIELHINLGVDPKQADQNVRDTVVLPAGTGKDIRVATVSDDASAEKLFAKLDKEDIDFDVLISTPDMMPKLGKYARLLGPRGLMPNPKSGTVTTDIAKAQAEAKAGRVEYRVDQSGIIHLAIGKVSFGKDKLSQNAEAVMASVRAAKPASLKGIYIKSLYVSSTMGPSIKAEV